MNNNLEEPSSSVNDNIDSLSTDRPHQIVQMAILNPDGKNIEPQQQQQANSQEEVQGNLLLEERIGFIRKVFSIISVQLSITFWFCLLAYESKEFQRFQIDALYLLILSVIGLFSIWIALMCFPQKTWKVPNNYCLLFAFTICMSWSVSFTCSQIYSKHGQEGGLVVLASAILCLALTLGLTLYAFNTSKDFTNAGCLFFMMIIGMFAFGILMMIFRSYWLHVMYSLICAIFYAIFLVYDVQLLLGNKVIQQNILQKKQAVTSDDYIIASLLIYTDIIQLFLAMLRVFVK